MDAVQITPKASRDIAKLAQGVDRAQVALEALRESKLTPKQLRQLKELLNTVGVLSATTSPGDIITIDNHKAVLGQIIVNGQQVDTLLSEGSFNKSRPDQREYAAELGYRMATREENFAYVDSLLAKEHDKSINLAEANALETYRKRFVRDDGGGLDVVDWGVRGRDGRWGDLDDPHLGALFVRASAESK